MTQTEINKNFDDKVRRGIFNPVARHLSDPSTAEDRLQTAICMTWAMYLRYISEKGKVLSDGVLVHSCKQRAVDLNRHFTPTTSHCRNQDVLDPRAYRDEKVEVLRLTGPDTNDFREGDRGVQIGYAEAMAIRPERNLNSAIDLQTWLDEQTSRDQLILSKKAEGHTYGEIAKDLSMSYSKVYERSKTLGMKLAARAGFKIGKRAA
jgi:hypothetical protein